MGFCTYLNVDVLHIHLALQLSSNAPGWYRGRHCFKLAGAQWMMVCARVLVWVEENDVVSRRAEKARALFAIVNAKIRCSSINATVMRGLTC